jgi:hypothetical protein
MSDSVSRFYDLQSSLNCRVGKQYPVLVLDGDNTNDDDTRAIS